MPKNGRTRIVVDAFLRDSVDDIVALIGDDVHTDDLGNHTGYRAEGERLVTHYFECLKPGYRGWHWAVTVARAPRSRHITVCEIDLMAAEGALLAPPWVPWAERLEPGDVRSGDVLPYRANDERLTTDAEAVGVAFTPERPRHMTTNAIGDAGKRWEANGSGRGVKTASGKYAAGRSSRLRERGDTAASTNSAARCDGCGFFIPLSGDVGRHFGVCGNEWALDDGQMVSAAHGCGAHSETDIARHGSEWPVVPSYVNEFDLEIIDLS